MDEKKKIELSEIMKFDEVYRTTYRAQKLRYGQAFCNHFDITDSDLFYMTSQTVACVYIINNYQKDYTHA